MKIVKLALLLTSFFVGSANATLITSSVGAFDGFDYTGADYTYDLADFVYALDGPILSASLSGVWGETDTYSGSTAHAELYVDGMLVADTHDPALICDPYSCVTPWSYTFADFSSLLDGTLDFKAVQTSYTYLRLGATELSIETGRPVPAPAGIALLALAVFGFGAARKRTN